MMWFGHIARRIADYRDPRGRGDGARAAEHLAACDRCASAADDFDTAARALAALPLLSAPESIWTAIERELDAPRRPERAPRWRPAIAIVTVAAALAALFVVTRARDRAAWQVARGDASFQRVAPGETFDTDATTRLTFRVGEIGTVSVEPGSRVSVVRASMSEHRLALARGAISAVISAPPRMFFVNTPSSTVVDLGCAYTMRVDGDGGGELRVTAGWAALESKGGESLVPAGASCRTRPGIGAGTPCFDDASPALREALTRFDFEGGDEAIHEILDLARPRDTLTLWHLLSRVPPDERVLVLDRLATLTPLPPSVARTDLLRLEPDALRRLREELAWTW
jgi:hypothetical protein